MASTADQDYVRILVYGGSTRSGTVSVADIGTVLDDSVNVYLAASRIALAEAANLARQTNLKVGDLSITRIGIEAAQYRTLSKDLRKQGVRSVKPFAGGISQAQKDTNENNSDRVSGFRIGMFDNPGSTST